MQHQGKQPLPPQLFLPTVKAAWGRPQRIIFGQAGLSLLALQRGSVTHWDSITAMLYLKMCTSLSFNTSHIA